MKKTFDLGEALEQIKSGASIDSKDGVLAPLIKQLTEAVSSAIQKCTNLHSKYVPPDN